jgi:hypothetical protein
VISTLGGKNRDLARVGDAMVVMRGWCPGAVWAGV